MEIIIRNRENGWETERRLELPEDEGLVKSILRSVKRRVNPPQLAGGGVIEDQAEEVEPADAVPEPEPQKEEPPAVERTTFETGYRGFLILTCGACGKMYTVNAREPVRETTCRECGHVTELTEMAAAELWCPVCGKTWKYRTNSEQAEVMARCIRCGGAMVSRWNSKKRRYLPQK